MRSAESWLDGSPQANAPTLEAASETSEDPPQPLFVAMTACVAGFWRVSCGSARVPGTLNGAAAMAGPDARMSTVSDVCPPMTKPAKRAFAPDPTSTLADRFTRRGIDGV